VKALGIPLIERRDSLDIGPDWHIQRGHREENRTAVMSQHVHDRMWFLEAFKST
jgi:hypothetical protein